MNWNVLRILLVAIGPLVSASVTFFVMKAVLRRSKSTRERAARKRFGWKLGIAMVLLSLSCSFSSFVNVMTHPVLFGLSIFFGIIVASPIYVALVILWSFQHKRELERITSQEGR